MKKILLSAAAVFAALSMNAQEICSFNADNALGLDADNGTALAAGTVIGETASIVATVDADETYKPQSVKATVTGGEINGGLQGGSNPKDADGGTPSSTLLAPVSGAYLQFEAKANGFLYIVHKASSNKAYTVFEEGTAIGYTFAAIGDASTDLGAVYQFTLKGEGEYNELKNPVEWAEQEFLKATAPEKYAAHQVTNDDGTVSWNAIKINGIGVIAFPVYKDCKYIVNANGSKITAGGFVFSPENNVSVSVDGVTIIGEGGSTPTIETWTVAGGSNLMGSNWDTADTNNDMNSTDGVTYTLVKEGVVLEKGVTYEFKVAKDHAWTEAYPGNNATLTVDETATYTVTFTFNAESKEVSASAEKTGEAVIGEKTYSVIGTINGNWDNDTDMTKDEDGLYTAVFENVKAGKYEFKVRVNHDWGENYGDNGNNVVLELEKDALSVKIYFNPESKSISYSVNYGGDTPVPTGNALIVALNADNELGLDADNGTSLAAGTVIGKLDEVGCVIGADDTYKPQDLTVVIDGVAVKGGLQGGSNPKDADGGTPSSTLLAPVSGAYLEFDANEDGFLYIAHKASSNKAYTVFEEGTAVGYTFAAIGDASTDLGAVYQFTLKGEGEYNELKNPVEWAEQEFLKATAPEKYAAHQVTNDDGTVSWNAIKINGIGVIAFPVYKDCKYIVNANGSKITAGAYAFSKADDVVIATEDGVEIYKGSGATTAIKSVNVVKVAANGAIYNLAGQKVDASYKGLVIKDGKKMIQK